MGPPEFSAYASQYLEGYAKTKLKQNTWQGYDIIIKKHLVPVWAGKRLNEIRRRDVKELILQKQRDGLAPGTVENIKALISGIFSHAYDEELHVANPALKMGKYISKSDHRKNATFLSKDAIGKFMTAVQEHHSEYYAVFLCAFRTGMRLGELLGLAWEDVNFDGNGIEICRSYSHGHFSSPKSHKSRLVDMSNQLKLVLQNQREQIRRRFGELPATPVPARLKGGDAVHLAFPSESGGPLDPDNFRHRVFYDVIEKANMPKFRLHDIRHTFASILLQNGEPIHYVKEQMGHASITTTVDTYGHVMPNANRNAVNKLDDVGSTATRPLALAV